MLYYDLFLIFFILSVPFNSTQMSLYWKKTKYNNITAAAVRSLRCGFWGHEFKTAPPSQIIWTAVHLDPSPCFIHVNQDRQ